MNLLRLGCVAAGAALLAALAVGCSSSRSQGKISGKVTLNGQPLPAGNLTFHSEGKGSYNAPLMRDGTYQVVDVPVGAMVVTVDTEFLNPNKKVPTYGGEKGKDMYKERMAAEQKAGTMSRDGADPYVKVPEKYRNAKTSPLKATVAGGKQVLDFTLTD